MPKPVENATMRPGDSRLRDVEKYLRENGVCLLPDSWDHAWVASKMKTKLGHGKVDLVLQFRMDAPVDPDALDRARLLVLIP